MAGDPAVRRAGTAHSARPVIGITGHVVTADATDHHTAHYGAMTSYARAVHRAGGLPVVISLVDPADAAPVLARLDGLVVTGGADVDPAAYGADPEPLLERTDPARDETDLAMCRAAVAANRPTLAICRGVQALNVAMGGTLVQHIDDHMVMACFNQTVHSVTVEPDSRLAAAVGGERTALEVNTLHHQCIAEVAPGARVVARAPDGTVEAIEFEGADHVLGVQWHPELLRHLDEHLALFEQLVRDAAAP